MKTIYVYLWAILCLVGCSKEYELDESFVLPTTFSSPESVNIDLNTSENIVFTWNGGANDGGVLLYNVLFDTEDGDFSEPVFTSQSDFGGKNHLTLTHIELNKIARTAGIKIGETGILKWTIEGSRGGVIHRASNFGKIAITRPSEEIPEQLFLLGTATECHGNIPVAFRKESDGVFVIYTKLTDGDIYFTDAMQDGVNYTVNMQTGKIEMGDIPYAVWQEEGVARLTVNFNTKTFSKELITSVRMIWGYTFDVIANLDYVGGGEFNASNVEIVFYDPNDPTTNPPAGLTWVEERYYFIATFSDGTEKCWGSVEEDAALFPGDNPSDSYYEIHEKDWSQWKWLWKMDHAFQKKNCTVSIHTNKNNMMLHSFSDIQ